MKRYTLRREQIIEKPRAEIFSFFEKPENLAKITPPSMRFKVLTPGPITMAAGALIDYTITIFGVRRRWTTQIAAYDPPHGFIDVQLRGPYSFWRHVHRFEDVAGGTRVSDNIEYIVPYGLLGRLVHAIFIKRQLECIFDYRARKIRDIFARDRYSCPNPAGKRG